VHCPSLIDGSFNPEPAATEDARRRAAVAAGSGLRMDSGAIGGIGIPEKARCNRTEAIPVVQSGRRLSEDSA
jgi:hypothetical protein